MHNTYPSITKFQQVVELKDFRPPTKKEYVRYVRKCAEDFNSDPRSRPVQLNHTVRRDGVAVFEQEVTEVTEKKRKA